MSTWSRSPFHPVVDLGSLPQGRVVSEDDGESRLVYEIEGHPDWLAKIYKSPLTATRAQVLRNLVYLPAVMSQADLELVDRCIAWPAARVADGLDIVGVVMAKAPAPFFTRLRTPSGLQGLEPLQLDWLVETDERRHSRGIAQVTTDVRFRAMLQMLAVGELFARHNLVYADWSYRNAFWDQHTGDVFVIDMDTCGIGARDWVESLGWEDPLYQDRTRPLDTYSDRYKIAVLMVRCLTGERKDPQAALGRLVRQVGDVPFTGALRRALTATRPTERPGPGELMAALSGAPPSAPVSGRPAGSANVTGHVPLRPRRDARRGGQVSSSGPGVPASADNVDGRVDLRARAGRLDGGAAGTLTSPPPPPPPPPPPAPPVPPLSPPRGKRVRRSGRGRITAVCLVSLAVVYYVARYSLGWV